MSRRALIIPFTISLVLACLTVQTAVAGDAVEPVAINEVFYLGDAAQDWMELINTGSTAVDLTNWWICSRFAYRRIGLLTILMGDDYVLQPGELLVLATTIDLNSDAGADLGLYRSSSFGDPDAMADFVQWSTSLRVGRSSEALAAGVWPGRDPVPVDFVVPAAAGETAAWCGGNSGGGELTVALDFINGAPTPGAVNGVACTEQLVYRDGFES
ncbi:MAG: hypothetical protein Tsb002_14150 [Wenzhouxiangellaceae bacterium]